MVKLMLSVSVLSASVLFVAAISLGASPAAPPAQAKKKAEPVKDLYVSNCQMCHGPDGRAPIKEMSFVGRSWKTKTTAEAIKVITNGVPGSVMLPFEGRLKKEQIAALAKYVRALDTPAARKKKGPVPAP